MLCHLWRTGALATFRYSLAWRRPPGATPFATDIRSGSWPRDRVRWVGVPWPPDRAAPGGRRRRCGGGASAPGAPIRLAAGKAGQVSAIYADVWDEPSGWPGAGGSDAVINTVGHYVERGQSDLRGDPWARRHACRPAAALAGSNGWCTLGHRCRCRFGLDLCPCPAIGERWCGNGFRSRDPPPGASCSGRTTRSSIGWRPWRGVMPDLPLFGSGRTNCSRFMWRRRRSSRKGPNSVFGEGPSLRARRAPNLPLQGAG